MDDSALKPGVVHVWTIDLDGGASEASSLLAHLSGEERVRSARLRTTDLRLRFVTAHGALRVILARYLRTSPDAVRVAATDAGKPYLPDGRLTFSLAHAEALAVCAVTLDDAVGVDVEQVRPVPDADAIARRYFSGAEVAAYAAHEPGERNEAFFSIWTRKEALVKALGDGGQCPLAGFDVEAAPAATRPRLSPDAFAERWSLASFVPAPGYVGAVARAGTLDDFRQFHFDEPSLRVAVNGA